MVRTIIGGVCVGLCALSIAAEAGERVRAGENVAASAASPLAAAAASPVARTGQLRQTSRKPTIRGAADARRAWLGAEHRGLTMQKTSNRVDGSLSIELRYGQDAVSIGIDVNGAVAVSRDGRHIRVGTAEALAQVQRLLSGSEAAIATRFLLAEREGVSDLNAGEMSLLSAAAFVASLLGDVDAPRRLAARFAAKQGAIRPVRMRNCYDTYTAEANASWNDMQNCMEEANQDSSVLNRAYRRVACNGIWLLRSESAWVEFLGCLGPGQIFQ
jgi:hypothetical protein